jgi:HSP20 family protein
MFFAPTVFSRNSFSSPRHSGRLNGYGSYTPSLWSDSFFSDVFDSASNRVNVDSDDTSVTLTLDVPGLSKEQLTIGIEGRVVRIASKDDAPRSFKAAYKIGSEIDPAKSEAKLENGVLTLKLGKVAPASRETVLAIV